MYRRGSGWPISDGMSSNGFKLRHFLDRHQGFEKVNTEETDSGEEDPPNEIISSASTSGHNTVRFA